MLTLPDPRDRATCQSIIETKNSVSRSYHVYAMRGAPSGSAGLLCRSDLCHLAAWTCPVCRERVSGIHRTVRTLSLRTVGKDASLDSDHGPGSCAGSSASPFLVPNGVCQAYSFFTTKRPSAVQCTTSGCAASDGVLRDALTRTLRRSTS